MYGKNKVYHMTRNAFRSSSRKGWEKASIKKLRKGARSRVRASLSQIVSEETWDECYEEFRERTERKFHGYCSKAFVSWVGKKAKDVTAEKQIGHLKGAICGNGKNVYFARQYLEYSNLMNLRFRYCSLHTKDQRPILTRDEIRNILYDIVTDSWTHRQFNAMIRNYTTSMIWYTRYEYVEPSPYGGNIIKHRYLSKTRDGVSKRLAGVHDIENFIDYYKRDIPMFINGDGIHYYNAFYIYLGQNDFRRFENRQLINPAYQPGVKKAVKLFVELCKDHPHDRQAIRNLVSRKNNNQCAGADYYLKSDPRYRWKW